MSESSSTSELTTRNTGDMVSPFQRKHRGVNLNSSLNAGSSSSPYNVASASISDHLSVARMSRGGPGSELEIIMES